MQIKIDMCPYEDNEHIFSKENLELQPGLTVLVGCNGSGKTSLLHQIKQQKENSTIIEFNNLINGGRDVKSMAAFENDYARMATSVISSEGENINLAFQMFAKQIGYTISHLETDELYILIDALDSGLSIDMIDYIKHFLKNCVLSDASKIAKTYIIIAANSYEMVRDEQCLSVSDLSPIQFKDYEEYRKFILDSHYYKSCR